MDDVNRSMLGVMASRKETAAATRRALLDAAGELLDSGGPAAVTLREVGARAGVSRTAAYRHFRDKESLLTAMAAEAWSQLGDVLQALTSDPSTAPAAQMRAALLALVEIGRCSPHLYQLLFTTPAADPTELVRAAERSNELFLGIVTECVGADEARRYGALLLTSAHGMAGLELSGHLASEKWRTTADDLIELLVSRLPARPSRP
ncbi:MAG: TetR/AcrR family transcriptional regulator [Solirubrobacteraceae bacterium]